MDNNELYHYGVKGMKWGVRKQYIKAKGRIVKKKAGKVYADIKKKVKARREAEKARKYEEDLMKKPVKKLTNAELQERAKILESRRQVLALEKSCKDLNKDTTNAGKAFMKDFAKNALGAAAIGAGKTVLQDYFTKIGKDKLGLSAKDVKDALPEVKTWDDMNKKLDYQNKLADKKAKEAEAAKKAEEDAAAEAKRAAAQKQVDDYNAKWAKGESQDSVTNATYSKKGSDINDATTSTKTSSSRKGDDAETFNTTADDIIGEGTSKRNSSNKSTRSKPSDYYDPIDGQGEWVKDDTSVSDVSTELVSTGRSYMNRFLLEDKSK